MFKGITLKIFPIPTLTVLAMTLGLASCATTTVKSSNYLEDVQTVLAASFRAEGQAGLDRLTPDEANRLCSQSEYEGNPLSDKQTEQIRNDNFKTIKWPSNGQFFGDYKLGAAKLGQTKRVRSMEAIVTTATRSATQKFPTAHWVPAFTTTASCVVSQM